MARTNGVQRLYKLSFITIVTLPSQTNKPWVGTISCVIHKLYHCFYSPHSSLPQTLAACALGSDGIVLSNHVKTVFMFAVADVLTYYHCLILLQ